MPGFTVSEVINGDTFKVKGGLEMESKEWRYCLLMIGADL